MRRIQKTQNIQKLARSVLTIEAQAILNLRTNINKNFVTACELLLKCQGRIIVTGIGKSGHIAQKIAATLASTGSPAFFMHPSEASHGDIGVITKKDIVIAISYSGNTEEILSLLPTIKLIDVPLISITGNTASTLAKKSDITLNAHVAKEACPLGLAPTSSTTAILTLGDALAVCLIELRGFTSEDFAKSHPGGILGKRLLLLVDHVMRTKSDIPKVKKDTFLAKALLEITNKRMGMTLVVNDNKKLLGIFTDGDLRRIMNKNLDIHKVKISQIMTTKCKTIAQGTFAIEAIKLMEEHQITSLVVIDKSNIPVGVVHMHDLLKSGLI